MQDPLHLWTHENSPQGRLVRECLTVLQIPYVYHTAAEGSHKEIPVEYDAAQGLLLIDSELSFTTYKEAISYLRKTYQTGDVLPMSSDLPAQKNLGRSGNFLAAAIKNVFG